MSLRKLVVDDINVKKLVSTAITSDSIISNGDILGDTITANTIKTGKLFMQSMAALNMKVNDTLTAKDIVARNLQLSQGMSI